MFHKTTVIAVVLLLATPPADVGAHGEAQHGESDAAAPQVLAPGYGALEFNAPKAGSYVLPPLGAAADGPVLRADGSQTTLHQAFGDGLVLLSFVYASCSDVNGCPLATAVLHRLKKRLRDVPEVAGRLRLVSLSFDPARDTPEVMRAYGAGFAGPGPEWVFLTTLSESALQPLLDAYGQSIVREVDAQGRDLGRISHVLRVFLIDRARRIRNVYSVSFLHPDTLLADVKTVLLADPSAPATPVEAQPGVLGPGDDRRGYDSADWRTQSVSLAARRGAPADLVSRLDRPPLGLPPVPLPEGAAPTRAKVALGRSLFFDRRLSANGTISCAMCHVPEQGFTSNEMRTAVGIEGRSVRRNTPSIYNAAYALRLFHDGRETSLEDQVWHPLRARNEMGNPSAEAVVERLSGLQEYVARFAEAFPDRGITQQTIGAALASYERTLISGGSAFDRWRFAGEAGALDAAARRGFELFSGRGACASCHLVHEDHALFTDHAFHDTGVGHARATRKPSPKQRVQVGPGLWLDVDRAIVQAVSEPPAGDAGRFEVTGDPADRWRYRTPSLRNVALTAPYMHDGSLATLEEVVDFYDRGGVSHDGLDPRIRALGLSAQERADLVAFLRALTGSDVATLVRDAFAAVAR